MVITDFAHARDIVHSCVCVCIYIYIEGLKIDQSPCVYHTGFGRSTSATCIYCKHAHDRKKKNAVCCRDATSSHFVPLALSLSFSVSILSGQSFGRPDYLVERRSIRPRFHAVPGEITHMITVLQKSVLGPDQAWASGNKHVTLTEHVSRRCRTPLYIYHITLDLRDT